MHGKKCIAVRRIFQVISAIFMVRIFNNIAGIAICFFVPATHFFACDSPVHFESEGIEVATFSETVLNIV